MVGHRGATMKAIRVGAALALAMFAAGNAEAALEWSDIDCRDADLQFIEGLKCRKSADTGSGVSTLRQHLSAVFGTVGGMQVNATLWVLSAGGVYSAYSADMSEKIIRAFANATTPTPERWGTYKGFAATGYITFRRGERDCVGFDHAPAGTGTFGISGYPYLLRGYFCEQSGITNAEARLRQVLAAFRIGGPGGGKNAFGEPVVSLTEPPLNAAAPVPSHALTALAPASTPSRTVPVAVSWDGVASLALGTMRYTGADGGDITLDLAEGGGRCVGTWKLLAAQGPAPPTGTWAISCPNGQAASGTYRATEAGKGAGEGIDAQGRKIAIKYGG